jgi:hypothetical protein
VPRRREVRRAVVSRARRAALKKLKKIFLKILLRLYNIPLHK